MKNKLKQEKKSHRADNASNEAKIAALSQQLAFMMAHTGVAQCTQRGKNPHETPQNQVFDFFEYL